MDDEAALIARRVAMAAAAWFNAPGDVAVYRRFVDALEEWNAYCAPTIDDLVDDEELLDQAVDPPVPLGETAAGLEAALRRTARRAL